MAIVFYGYILLACKNPCRAAPGPHSSNQSIASIIPRELDCSAPLLQAASEAPTSGQHGCWYPGGQGRGRNSGVWAWNQLQVATLVFSLFHHSWWPIRLWMYGPSSQLSTGFVLPKVCLATNPFSKFRISYTSSQPSFQLVSYAHTARGVDNSDSDYITITITIIAYNL